jgi:hypothetical protein
VHLSEHRDELRDVMLRRLLEADLLIVAIVAEPEIGRRRHATVDGSCRQFLEFDPRVARYDFDHS